MIVFEQNILYFQKKTVTLHIVKWTLQFNQTQTTTLGTENDTMSGLISHKGIIDSISEGMVRVSIVQSSACSSCKVASYCTSAESKEKFIEVKTYDTSSYEVGQEVNVVGTTSMGMKAVVLAFVIPTVLLMAVVIIALTAGASELTAALSGLLSLVPYYILLYMLRGTLEKKLSFWIKEVEN